MAVLLSVKIQGYFCPSLNNAGTANETAHQKNAGLVGPAYGQRNSYWLPGTLGTPSALTPLFAFMVFLLPLRFKASFLPSPSYAQTEIKAAHAGKEKAGWLARLDTAFQALHPLRPPVPGPALTLLFTFMTILLSLEIHGLQLPPLPLPDAHRGTSFQIALNLHGRSPFPGKAFFPPLSHNA